MTVQPENPMNGKVVKPSISNPTPTPKLTSQASPQHPKSELSMFEGFGIENEETFSPEELAEIWARRAYDLAKEPPAEAAGQTMDLLVFWLGEEGYGIDVTNVREIHPLEQVTPVPRTPDFVAGVFSARGRILSVIDLRAFFGLPAAAPNKPKEEEHQAKVIVVTKNELTSESTPMEVGLLVDEVDDVVTIFKEEIEPPLATHGGTQAEHIRGITADMLVVLDLDTLLNDKRLVVYEELM